MLAIFLLDINSRRCAIYNHNLVYRTGLKVLALYRTMLELDSKEWYQTRNPPGGVKVDSLYL